MKNKYDSMEGISGAPILGASLEAKKTEIGSEFKEIIGFLREKEATDLVSLLENLSPEEMGFLRSDLNSTPFGLGKLKTLLSEELNIAYDLIKKWRNTGINSGRGEQRKIADEIEEQLG